MKKSPMKAKVAETALGAVVGGVIAGPVGAVAGGLVAGHVESGLERFAKLEPPAKQKRSTTEDPIIHSHPKRILVPLDFSLPARRALRFAMEWALVFGAEVRLIHVINPTATVGEFGTVPMGQPKLDLVSRAKRALEKVARQEFPEFVTASVEVRNGAAYDEIVRAAGKWKADLILMATKGHGGIEHALLGSTAERVVRDAPCPVLTLRRAHRRKG